MMVTIRPLGLRVPIGGGRISRDAINGAVRAIVGYLNEDRSGNLTQLVDEAVSAAKAGQGSGGYYGEGNAERGKRRWLRNGGVGTTVHGDLNMTQLGEVLAGRDPHTGAELMNRSVVRAEEPEDKDPPEGTMSAQEAASALHVTPRRVRQMAEVGADPDRSKSKKSWIVGDKGDGGEWRFDVTEVEAAKRRRDGRAVTLGFDVTFSAPKSVSLLWAGADEEVRGVIEEAWEEAIDLGVDYLSRHGLQITVGRGENRRPHAAQGTYIAGFRHPTNRYGEPQLHEHVLIANMGDTGDDNKAHALDARGLWTHATTAGYLSGAAIRNRLTDKLGVVWDAPDAGLADLADMSPELRAQFSSRRKEIMALVAGAGMGDSIAAREVASVATRPDKETDETLSELFERWGKELVEAGFDEEAIAGLLHVEEAAAPTEETIGEFFADLLGGGPLGLTRYESTFDRRDVIQAVCEWSNNRLSGQQLLDVADKFLATSDLVPLNLQNLRKLTPRAGWLYTTRDLLTDGDTIRGAYARPPSKAGLDPDMVSRIIDGADIGGGAKLGDDQVAMVHKITESGLDCQAVIGQAGSGKTVALKVAADAWKAAGFTVTGAAVGGVAADVLARSTGLETRTVASLLHDIARGNWSGGNVLIVDEAGTLGDRAHAALIRAAEANNAIVRTVGDPLQHGSVEAGGMWAQVAHDQRGETAELTENRRQTDPQMRDVVEVLDIFRKDTPDAYRNAMEILDEAGRIINAATPDAAYESIIETWWKRERHRPEGDKPSDMMAEHHEQRKALCFKAQALLLEEGKIEGVGLPTGEAVFYKNDRVVCRSAWSTETVDGQRVRVRNGQAGVVREIDWEAPGGPAVVVDWEDDKGRTAVGHADLWRELRPGVSGILAPTYARTSFGAQGSTYDAGYMMIDVRTTRAGTYVGATRGRYDTQFFTLDLESLNDPSDDADPFLERFDNRMRLPQTEAIIERLCNEQDPIVPAADDPSALRLFRLLHGLDEDTELTAEQQHRLERLQRWRRNGDAIHGDALPDYIRNSIGDRPAEPHLRPLWDAAVDVALGLVEDAGLDAVAKAPAWSAAYATLRAGILADRSPSERESYGAENPTELGAEIVRQADAVDVRRACLHPDDALIALIGPRPGATAPDERRLWMRRAGAIERWVRQHARTTWEGRDGLPGLPPDATPQQVHAYRAAQNAVSNVMPGDDADRWDDESRRAPQRVSLTI